VSGGPTALPGLYFCGQLVSPSGMLREIGREARRIASQIARSSAPGAGSATGDPLSGRT